MVVVVMEVVVSKRKAELLTMLRSLQMQGSANSHLLYAADEGVTLPLVRTGAPVVAKKA